MTATPRPALSILAFLLLRGFDPRECTPTGETLVDWFLRWLKGNRGPVVGGMHIKRAGAVVQEPLFRWLDLLRAANAWEKRGAAGEQLQLGFR